ncbi:MFS transporter [Corynebacterium mendelii]|uniref:MFS transporter n=1 Tax=Corynebacterium mendelii TaxID=2765362 RepID=A0A939E210_9CORY|nr:MFS transporter [Corynebacterium mendelii]MBN9644984.1 MFS transporter [Corynebacterium mendelii]
MALRQQASTTSSGRPPSGAVVDVPIKQAWLALASLCIGFFMILLDQTVVAVATPDFQEGLNATLNQVVWVTSIYLLFFAVPLLVTGRMGDRFGQRRVFVVGVSVFTVSSLACGLAPTAGSLIAARAVQGLGAALLGPQSMSVINRIFPRDKRGAAMGIWGSVGGLATLVGPLLGGLIVGTIGWQWVFFINVPIGIVCVVMVMKFVPDMPRTARRMGLGSVIVSILAVAGVVFALQDGPKIGWNGWIIATLCCGLVLCGVFVRMQKTQERRGDDALVPPSLFSNHNFTVGTVSIFTMGFTVGAVTLPIMIHLQQGLGLSAEKAGFCLVPMAVISGVLAPFAGRLSDRLHPKVLSVGGFAAMTVGVAWLAAVMRDGVGLWWIFPAICLMGVGHGFIWSPNAATSMRDVQPTAIGAASGVYNTTRQVGSVLGAAAVGAIMQIEAARHTISTAMGNSVIIIAVVLAGGLVAVSFFKEVPPQYQQQ